MERDQCDRTRTISTSQMRRQWILPELIGLRPLSALPRRWGSSSSVCNVAMAGGEGGSRCESPAREGCEGEGTSDDVGMRSRSRLSFEMNDGICVACPMSCVPPDPIPTVTGIVSVRVTRLPCVGIEWACARLPTAPWLGCWPMWDWDWFWDSIVPRRSTRFIFFRHRSHTVPGPSGPGPHFSTHLPSL